ncbi:MAG: DoxX family protein, partial [Gammaproteobacteria bacterium]|nr:DoxX family protein [Gammaproteobacteria bacterium]
ALLPLVILLELGGGLALVAGFQTRMVALLLAAFCIVSALLFHMDFAQKMQQIMFMKNLAIAGGLLSLALSGGRPASLDGRWAVRDSDSR